MTRADRSTTSSSVNPAPLTGTPSIQRQLALLTLLGDDDPGVSEQIRAQLIAGGQGTLEWLENHRYHDEPGVRRRLLEEYGIEIGAGLGPMAGKAWRIGLMGHGSSVRNVDLVLAALRTVLR